MTRNERILKLGRAFRRWRGSYHPETKKWIRQPNPNALGDVIKWLESLQTNHGAAFHVERLNAMQSWNEWTAFVKELEARTN